MKTAFILCLICLGAASCDMTIATFKEPQPAGKKALPAFPEKLIGYYAGNDGTATLTISDQTIIYIQDYEDVILKANLDTSYYLSGNVLVHKETGSREPVTVHGDSIMTHIHDVDTVGNLSRGDVLKTYKGYYFLNTGNNTDGWMVTRFALTHGKLITAYISDTAAINKLDELADQPLDTATKQYTISKKKFKTFLKSGGFNNQDTFTRIR